MLVRREFIEKPLVIAAERPADGGSYGRAAAHPLFALDDDRANLTAVAKHERPDCFGVLSRHEHDIILRIGYIVRFGIVELQIERVAEPGGLANPGRRLARV